MTMSGTSSPFADTLAKIITVIFHPLLMPLYGLLIIFSAPTLFGYLPFVQKKVIVLILSTNNILLPLSLLPYLKWRKLISSWSINERSERIIPMALTSFFYFVTVYVVVTLQHTSVYKGIYPLYRAALICSHYLKFLVENFNPFSGSRGADINDIYTFNKDAHATDGIHDLINSYVRTGNFVKIAAQLT